MSTGFSSVFGSGTGLVFRGSHLNIGWPPIAVTDHTWREIRRCVVGLRHTGLQAAPCALSQNICRSVLFLN